MAKARVYVERDMVGDYYVWEDTSLDGEFLACSDSALKRVQERWRKSIGIPPMKKGESKWFEIEWRECDG